MKQNITINVLILILLITCFLSVILHITSIESFIGFDTKEVLGNKIKDIQGIDLQISDADYELGIDYSVQNDQHTIQKENEENKRSAREIGEQELKQAGIDGIGSLGDLVPYLTYDQHRKMHYYKRKQNYEDKLNEEKDEKTKDDCAPFCPKNMYEVQDYDHYEHILYTHNDNIEEIDKNQQFKRNVTLVNGILNSQLEFLNDEKNRLQEILEIKK